MRPSDVDQSREHWVQNPIEWLTSARLSPNGECVALTARGQVFVAPCEDGRLVAATREPGVRWRQARFLPDGKSLVGAAGGGGEVEWWKLPANGVAGPAQLSHDGRVLRFDGVPSPDGKWIAHTNKDQELWLLDLPGGKDRRIAVSEEWDDIRDVAWWPGSPGWGGWVPP